MKGVCKHCLKPIQTESAGGSWQAFGSRYPTICEENDGKLHEEILQGTQHAAHTVETGNVRISLFPSLAGGKDWYPSDAEQDEVLGLDGVCECGLSHCGTYVIVDCDSLENLPALLSQVSIGVLDIIKKYDQWADTDRMPPREEEEDDADGS